MKIDRVVEIEKKVIKGEWWDAVWLALYLLLLVLLSGASFIREGGKQKSQTRIFYGLM
jgi:hypothetical protein